MFGNIADEVFQFVCYFASCYYEIFLLHIISFNKSNCIIIPGTRAYDKLSSIILDTRLINAIRMLSSEDQTSCLEGLHSTLNQWHPKMYHFSWLGTKCRSSKLTELLWVDLLQIL